MRLGAQTLVVRRAGSKPADYGNGTVPDWSPAAVTDTTVTGCSVQPVPFPENTVDRDNVRVVLRAWVPAGADVTALDRVVYEGDVYDIDGEPERWPMPRLDHLVVNLRRSTG